MATKKQSEPKVEELNQDVATVGEGEGPEWHAWHLEHSPLYPGYKGGVQDKAAVEAAQEAPAPPTAEEAAEQATQGDAATLAAQQAAQTPSEDIDNG